MGAIAIGDLIKSTLGPKGMVSTYDSVLSLLLKLINPNISLGREAHCSTKLVSHKFQFSSYMFISILY